MLTDTALPLYIPAARGNRAAPYREASVAANPERGEVDVEIGGEVRTLRFRTAEMLILEEHLGKDVISYIAGGGGQTKFIVGAIYAGLSAGGANKKVTPIRVANWLDRFTGDRTELQKKLLVAIARGKPGEEGIELAKVFEEAFGTAPESPGAPGGPSPTNAG